MSQPTLTWNAEYDDAVFRLATDYETSIRCLRDTIDQLLDYVNKDARVREVIDRWAAAAHGDETSHFPGGIPQAVREINEARAGAYNTDSDPARPLRGTGE